MSDADQKLPRCAAGGPQHHNQNFCMTAVVHRQMRYPIKRAGRLLGTRTRHWTSTAPPSSFSLEDCYWHCLYCRRPPYIYRLPSGALTAEIHSRFPELRCDAERHAGKALLNELEVHRLARWSVFYGDFWGLREAEMAGGRFLAVPGPYSPPGPGRLCHPEAWGDRL